MFIVSGGSGMVGSYLNRLMSDRKLPFWSPTRAEMDLANLSSLSKILDERKPKVFIHLAAETDVDLCERDPQHAYERNTLATKTIAVECARRDIDLLYISTSNVFGAANQYNYNELDTPAPLNYYGKSKLRGEEVIRREMDNFYIIRSGWMIGGGPDIDKKFVGKIIRQIREGKKELTIVADKFGSLTYAKHLSSFIIELIEKKAYGTYHFASSTACTRLDVAKKLVQHFECDVKLNPCLSSSFPLSAPRPLSEVINSVCLNRVTDLGRFTWEELLTDYLKEWQSGY